MKNYGKLLGFILSCLIVGCADDRDADSSSAVDSKAVSELSRPGVPITTGAVQIGTQRWMTKNLDVSHYRNGEVIPQVQDQSLWHNLTFGAWCYYNNNAANGVIYGKLYNWYAVNDPRGLAPEGWHIPTDTEFDVLTDFLGGPFVAGGFLKATTLWGLPNAGATNSTGFTALPGGYRDDYNGIFYGKGNVGLWWSATGTPFSENDLIWNVQMEQSLPQLALNYKRRTTGMSVRCLKN